MKLIRSSFGATDFFSLLQHYAFLIVCFPLLFLSCSSHFPFCSFSVFFSFLLPIIVLLLHSFHSSLLSFLFSSFFFSFRQLTLRPNPQYVDSVVQYHLKRICS